MYGSATTNNIVDRKKTMPSGNLTHCSGARVLTPFTPPILFEWFYFVKFWYRHAQRSPSVESIWHIYVRSIYVVEVNGFPCMNLPQLRCIKLEHRAFITQAVNVFATANENEEKSTVTNTSAKREWKIYKKDRRNGKISRARISVENC